PAVRERGRDRPPHEPRQRPQVPGRLSRDLRRRGGAPHCVRDRHGRRDGRQRRDALQRRVARERRGLVRGARVRRAGRLAVPHVPRAREAPPPSHELGAPARRVAALRLMAGALPIGDPAPPDGRLPDEIRPSDDTDFGVYLHVPFCRVRCGYCDFNTYTATELRGARQDQYADTLLGEIRLARAVLGEAGAIRPARTVCFGGGTPTLLPAGDLARMLDGVRGAFGVADDAEITAEANPDTVTPEVVRDLAAAGVNRMSIG